MTVHDQSPHLIRDSARTVTVTHDWEHELTKIIRDTSWLYRALVAARSLDLQDWCIGAGAVRNAVWDALHDYRAPSPLADIDVAYFDASDVSQEHDDALQCQLVSREADLPWEVTNQAGVHRWFEQVFGNSVEPLGSLQEAVASWPETATSVAVTLTAEGRLDVIAPLGLDDLFGMVVRRNPRRVSVETYRKRTDEKRYADRWPRVRVIPP
jgi:hypothetical protein